jgi:hypothetical protein
MRSGFYIEMKRQHIFERDGWECQNPECGGSIHRYGTPQLAHLIKQSKYNLKKYGAEVIHNSLNMKSVCCLECNAALDFGVNQCLIDALVHDIMRTIETFKKLENATRI